MVIRELTLSTEKLDVLNDFKKRLEADRTISSGDVRSLEATLGEVLVSDKIDMRRLSERRSAIGVEEIRNILNDISVKSSIANKVTFQDLVRMYDLVVSKLRTLDYLVTDLCGINGDVINTLRSDQFRWYYDHQDKLCDIANINLSEWLVYYGDQLQVIFKHLGDNDESHLYENFRSQLVRSGLDHMVTGNANIGISAIFSFLMHPGIKAFGGCYEKSSLTVPMVNVNVDLMFQLIDKRFEIKRNLEHLLKHIEAQYHRLFDYNEHTGYLDKKCIDDEYHQLVDIYSNIKDEADLNFVTLVIRDVIIAMSALMNKEK